MNAFCSELDATSRKSSRGSDTQGCSAPPNKSSHAAPGALQSGLRFDHIMCTEQGGVCIPTGDEQAMTGGELDGLVMVEIVHVKRPPEDQRVCEYKV